MNDSFRLSWRFTARYDVLRAVAISDDTFFGISQYVHLVIAVKPFSIVLYTFVKVPKRKVILVAGVM